MCEAPASFSTSVAAPCTACAAGTYNALAAGTSACTACAMGTYTTLAGRTACTACGAGRYYSPPGCPAGYTAAAGSSVCYVGVTALYTWADAVNNCAALGGVLASIRTAAELAVVRAWAAALGSGALVGLQRLSPGAPTACYTSRVCG